jgi:rubredoxin
MVIKEFPKTIINFLSKLFFMDLVEKGVWVKAYICSVCGFLYDDETAEKNTEGVSLPFEELSDDWNCPACGVKQDLFLPTDSDRPEDILEHKIF